MGLLGTIGVKLRADTAQFQRDLKGASGSIKDFGAAAKKVSVAATAVFGSIVGAVGLSVNALNKQIVAETRLEAAAKGSRHALDPERIKKLASAIQDLTGVGDEATISTAGFLAGLDLNQQAIENILPGIVAMGQVTGRSADRIARAMGSALQGSVSSLASYGLSLTETEKKLFKLGDASKRAEIIAQAMQRTFGSAAEDMRKTAVGGFGSMVNRLGDLQEAIGKIFDSPLGAFFNRLEEGIKRVIEYINNLNETTKRWIFRGTAVAAAVAGLTAIMFGLVAAFVVLGPIIIATAKIMAIIIGVGLAVVGVVKLLRAAWENDWGYIRTIVKAVVDTIKRQFQAMTDAIKWAINGIIKIFAKAAFKIAVLASKVPGLTDSMKESLHSTMKAMAGILKAEDPIGNFMGKAKDTLKDKGLKLVSAAKDLGADIGEGLAKELDAILKKFGLDVSLIKGPKAKGTGGGGGGGGSGGSGVSKKENIFASGFAAIDEQNMQRFKFAAHMLGKEVAPEMIEAGAEMVRMGVKVPEALESVAEMIEAERPSLREKFDAAMEFAGGQLIDAVASGSQKFGAVLQGATEGAEAEGVWGAIIGAIIALLTQTQFFARAIQMVDFMLGVVVNILDRLLSNFQPLMESLTSLGQVTTELFFQTSGLFTIFQVLGVVLTEIADVIDGFVQVIRRAWNSIIRKIANWAKKFGFDGLAKKIRKSLIHLEELPPAMEAAADIPTPDLGDFGSACGDAADAAEKLSESMLNVPSGFKVALRHFQAIDPALGANVAPTTATTTNTGTTVNGGVTINVTGNEDPEATAAAVVAALEQEAYMNEGSSQSSGYDYGTTQYAL